MAIKGERGKRWIFVNVATKQYVNASRSLISERKPGHCVEGIMRANSIDQLYIKQISMYFLLPFSNLKKKDDCVCFSFSSLIFVFSRLVGGCVRHSRSTSTAPIETPRTLVRSRIVKRVFSVRVEQKFPRGERKETVNRLTDL